MTKNDSSRFLFCWFRIGPMVRLVAWGRWCPILWSSQTRPGKPGAQDHMVIMYICSFTMFQIYDLTKKPKEWQDQGPQEDYHLLQNAQARGQVGQEQITINFACWSLRYMFLHILCAGNGKSRGCDCSRWWTSRTHRGPYWLVCVCAVCMHLDATKHKCHHQDDHHLEIEYDDEPIIISVHVVEQPRNQPVKMELSDVSESIFDTCFQVLVLWTLWCWDVLFCFFFRSEY